MPRVLNYQMENPAPEACFESRTDVYNLMKK